MKPIFYNTCILIMSISFLSCTSKTELNNKDLVSNHNKVIPNDRYVLDIVMKNDTLEKKLQKVELIFFFKIDDTIKQTPEDSRLVSSSIALVSNIDIKNRPKPISLPVKQIRFTPINSNDTIRIPFKITPSFSGKARFIAVIEDHYFLNAYGKDGKIRHIWNETTLQKEVFIK